MTIKTLYADVNIFNQNILTYLSKIKAKEPTVSGNSVCYYTDKGPVLIEPSSGKIKMLLGDESNMFGDLERLSKGENLN
jgi:hypothetical protein